MTDTEDLYEESHYISGKMVILKMKLLKEKTSTFRYVISRLVLQTQFM
jgi:hypothetical protein